MILVVFMEINDQIYKKVMFFEVFQAFIHDHNNHLRCVENYIYILDKYSYDKNIDSRLRNVIDGLKAEVDLCLTEFGIITNMIRVDHDRDKKSLFEIVIETEKMIRPFLESARLKLEMNIDRNIYLLCKKREIIFVLYAILKNSIEASSPNHNIIIDAKTNKSDMAAIKIVDYGSGIDSSIINEIFKPGFTTKTNNVGMGLFLVNKIIKEHHGEINISSKLGAITEVTITLPKI